MRLLTHNVLKNNSAAAKGNGYPLRMVSVTSVRVDPTPTVGSGEEDESTMKIKFIESVLPTIHWSGLVQVCVIRCAYALNRQIGTLVSSSAVG
jgi:hypothetical protein